MTDSPPAMSTRRLGQGLEVSAIGLGRTTTNV
jgi:hypothetical protein